MIKMSTEAERKITLLKKHKPLTPEEVYTKMKESHDARRKFSQDLTKIEENLIDFLNREDPLVDPATGKVLGWIRHAPLSELMGMKPEGFEGSDELSNEELMKKIEKEAPDQIFRMMANLITKPKYTAEEWKKIATVELIQLFNIRLTEIVTRLTEQVGFF